MRRLLTVLYLATITALLAGCGVTVVNGSGKVITQSRTVSNFSTFTLAGLGDVIITQGATESLTIEAEDNVMPLLKSEVKAGNLIIYMDQKDWKDVIRPTKPIKIALAAKNLSLIELTGMGTISSPSFKAAKLTVQVSGAGAVKIPKLEATDLKTVLSGFGNTELDGQVTSQEVEMTGAGQYLAGNLSSQTAKVTVTGTGNATVWARDTLSVTIGGAGNVSYYGNPKVTKSITGLGLLSPLGAK